MNLVERLYMTFIYQDRWQFFATGLLMTLILTFSSFLLGSVVGGVICMLRLRNHKLLNRILGVITGFLVEIPTLVLLLVFLYVVFSGASFSTVVVCIISLTLKSGAYLSDIFCSAILSVDRGEIEAARALGMSGLQAFKKITLPQAVSNAIGVYQNQFVICLQETSIVSSLAVHELTKASNIVISRTLDAMFGLVCVSVIYILVGVFGSRLIGLINAQKHLEEAS